MIRKANSKDLVRIAEILVFSKRINYREIFKDDHTSFNVITVESTINEYKDLVDNIYVYDDGIIKGMIRIVDNYIKELYVEPFFTNQSIGSKLIEFAISEGCNRLWALEKNKNALRFYARHGFFPNGNRTVLIDDVVDIELSRK